MLINTSAQCRILVFYFYLLIKKYNRELVRQTSPASKVCGGSFSDNGGGLNIWGTEKVCFSDLFLKAYRFNLGYCAHLLANFTHAAK